MRIHDFSQVLVPDRKFVEFGARRIDVRHVAKALTVCFNAADPVIGYTLVAQDDEMF